MIAASLKEWARDVIAQCKAAFPRSYDRGLIEGRANSPFLDVLNGRFRDHMIAASLKGILLLLLAASAHVSAII